MTSIVKYGAWAALLAGWLTWAAPVAAETALTPHTAEYKVKISVLGGRLITQLKEMDRKGQTEEERARAVENRDLQLAAKKLEKKLAELQKQIEEERSTVAEMERLKDRQIVLREQLE